MELEELINKVSEKLDAYSEQVTANIRELTSHFNDVTNLSEEENKATQISFWRSMDDKSCGAVIERVIEDEIYDDQIESKYQRFQIFENWQDCISWSEIFSYIEEDENLADPIDTALEILYIQWFVKNWYKADGHKSKNIEYYLIENNSVRNFDLKRFNFTDMFPNHNGIEKENPYYDFELKDYEVRNRVLMDMVDHSYHKPIIRRLQLGESEVVFWYSKCELIVREIKEGEIPNILLAKKLKSNEDKYRFKFEHLTFITMEIEKLIDKGYREIE